MAFAIFALPPAVESIPLPSAVPEQWHFVVKVVYLLVGWLIVLTLFFVVRRLEAGLSRQVVESKGLTCIYCGYDLRCSTEDRCSECGKEQVLTELPGIWQGWLPM